MVTDLVHRYNTISCTASCFHPLHLPYHPALYLDFVTNSCHLGQQFHWKHIYIYLLSYRSFTACSNYGNYYCFLVLQLNSGLGLLFLRFLILFRHAVTRPDESYCVYLYVWSQKPRKGPHVPVGNLKGNEWMTETRGRTPLEEWSARRIGL
jgi:hypothetical protein